VPRPVDQDDAVLRRQPLAQRQPGVAEIAAGAMQQQHRRSVRGAEFQHMQAAAVDVDKAAGRRIAALDQPRAGKGHRRKRDHDHDKAEHDHLEKAQWTDHIL
jgi:hypothetical protein